MPSDRERPQQHRQAARGEASSRRSPLTSSVGSPARNQSMMRIEVADVDHGSDTATADREAAGKLQETLPAGQPRAQARLHCRERDRLHCLLKASHCGWSQARRCVVKCDPAINVRP